MKFIGYFAKSLILALVILGLGYAFVIYDSLAKSLMTF